MKLYKDDSGMGCGRIFLEEYEIAMDCPFDKRINKVSLQGDLTELDSDVVSLVDGHTPAVEVER